jgi:tetratricopeptide (TPR) repeat protein
MIVAFCLSGMALAAPQDLEPDRAAEPLLANGTLAIYRGDFTGALRFADTVLTRRPEVLKALELRALALKGLGREDEALETYRRASRAALRETHSEAAQAPYSFEIGLIELGRKHRTEARRGLELALKHGFNPVAAQFFLGTLDLEEAMPEEAEKLFRAVLDSGLEDVRPVAAYYLGQIAGSRAREDTVRSSRYFVLARTLASRIESDPSSSSEGRALSQKILASVKPVLDPLSSGRWFGNGAVLVGYDSNVLSVPSTTLGSASAGPSQASGLGIARFGLGHASSALETTQFTWSYQGNLNYCFNRATESGQFLVHDLKAVFTDSPLGPSTSGAKLEAIGIFQFQRDPDTGLGAYGPYSLGALVGPFIRRELSSSTVFGAEIVVGSSKNFTDPNVAPNFKRTGAEEHLKISVSSDTREPNWNPGIGLTLDATQPDGDEFASKGATLEFSNRLFPGSRTIAELAVDVGVVAYTSRPGSPRYDKIASAQANFVQPIGASRSWNFLGSLQAIYNLSNIPDAYEYTRFVVATGVGYTF